MHHRSVPPLVGRGVPVVSSAIPLPLQRGTGAFALLVGATALTGWALDLEVLKGAGHRITMKPNAAVGLICCGVALLCHSTTSAPRRMVSIVASVLAGSIGLLTLSQHLLGWNLGIDELLFREAPGAPFTTSPGRMGPNASTSLSLAGAALLALHTRSARAAVSAQACAFVMMALAGIALVGYLLGAQQLYSATRYTAIAYPTALSLLAISIGILAVRPEVGPVAALVSRGPGGIIARRMLLPALLLPVVLGYVRDAGERAGLYDMGLGTALLAVSLCVVFAVAIWGTALRLDEANRARELVQRERDELLVREQASRHEAERASALKDEFLATLSHELRTPLNAIVGWAHMLQTQQLGDEHRAHGTDVIVRNGRTMVRLVEDLLDVSRIVSGRIHLDSREVDVVELTRGVVDSAAAHAGPQGITLRSRLDHAAIVVGDPERLLQIVGNLMSNAVKFTPPGGIVDVDVRVLPPRVQISVHDTGRGIDPAFLPHVFDRFRQQDATVTREHTGLGLGLSIVRELTQLHGGTVTAASPGRGQGSTFTVTLPLAGTAGAPARPSASPASSSPSPTVSASTSSTDPARST